MKNAYYFLTLVLLLIVSNIQAQHQLDGFWLYNDDIGLAFNDSNTVESKAFSFFHQYMIQEDTLTILHDYSDQECWTENEQGERSKCPQLANSVFRILALSDTLLTLCPINVPAMQIANEITIPFLRYSRELYEMRYQSIQENWQESIPTIKETSLDEYFAQLEKFPIYDLPPIDTVSFYPAKSIYTPITFDSISISYFAQGWFTNQYYYDLKLYSDGSFIVRNSKTSDQKEVKTSNYGLFTSRIPHTTVTKLNQLLSASGILKLKSKVFRGWTSHGKNIKMSVYYDGKCKTFEGVQNQFSIMLEPIVATLLTVENFEDYQRISRAITFETTFKK